MKKSRPSELKLTVAPQRRFEAIDIASRFSNVGEIMRRHQRAVFCSFHTTAGYLDRSLAVRMNNSHDLLAHFFLAFRSLFPEGGEYSHDQMSLRTELSEAQKVVEPRNGDSHLTFIGARMRNCVTQRTSPETPVYFIELDGTTPYFNRERKTTVIGYDNERVIAQISVSVPVSKHPIDSINLGDPRLGLVDSINDLIRRSGVEHARVDMVVDHSERNVGLTVNEYETLLIQNDLMDVLRDPFRFARQKTRHMIDDPLSIPGKTLSYAQYDAVRILNSLMEALQLDQSSFERLIGKIMSLPARCFFRSRRVSFLASKDGADTPRLLSGTYQSPILVQWQSAEKQTRNVDINLVELFLVSAFCRISVAMKKALITGITGQDGSYLAELLLSKGYYVWGVIRRSSSFNTGRIDHIYQDPHDPQPKLKLAHGDLNDASSLNRIIRTVAPDEIYNLGAQSHVRVSFDVPEYTGEVTGLGATRLLEAIRESGIQTRFYNASSSEMFGSAPAPQNEQTPFWPRSPYAAAKVYAHWMTVNYREGYNIFACNGILFNHESPRRGETFVTRKITMAVARIKLGKQNKLFLGNLDAKRDWGFAGDYVEAMWMMMQQEKPDDFVIATGETHSVREFLEESFGYVGLKWQDYVEIDPRYFRPTEVDLLQGDSSKAQKTLGWKPRVGFKELARMMVDADLQAASK